MSVSKIAGVVLSSAALVAGHGYVSGAVVDGQYYGGFLVDKYSYMSDPPKVIGWSEDATDLGFVDGSSYSDADIICHKDAKAAGLSASVKAGGSVELQWTKWPESHHGPVITYLANCNGDCSNVDKTALEFFKIDESGLISDDNVPGTWATDDLISNNNSYTVTIPSGIESGNYVLRHEIIALHSAGESNGAQNYPQCLNLEVTGGGSDSPSGTVGTELYTNTDPGIKVNIYQSMSSYTIPGPALYSGVASPSGSASSGSAVSTPLSTKATATAAPSTQAAGGSVAPIATASASTVSASPLRSPSAIPHSSRISRGSRPTVSSHPGHSGTFSASAPKVTVPGRPERPTKPAPSVTVTSQSQATDQVTVIDQPASQTSNAAPGATFTATPTGQSAQSSSPAGEDNSAPSAVPSAVPSSTPTIGGSGTTSASSGVSTGSGSQGDASSYNSSDWSSYLNSMSADQFLNMLRDTMKWLVTDKKHARDLNI